MRTLLFPAALFLSTPLLAQLGPEHRFIYPSTGTALAIHDMDGDGDGDVLRATTAGLLLSEQLAPDEYSVTHVLAPASGALRLAFGDLDGDGIDDVLIPDMIANAIQWVRVLGGGNYGAPATALSGLGRPLQVEAADIDGDGDQDLLFAEEGAGTLSFVWAANQGGGAFGTPAVISAFPTPLYYFLSDFDSPFATGDIDGDGDVDIATLHPTLRWLMNDGSGTFSEELLTGMDGTDLALADVDVDGDLDLWVIHASGEATKLLNNGDGSFAAEQVVGYLEASDFSQYHGVSVGDHDGDGDPDLFFQLLFGPVFNLTSVNVMVNDGTGDLDYGSMFAGRNTYQAYTLGALDADGRVDVVACSNDVTLAYLSGGGSVVLLSSVAEPRQLTVDGQDVVVAGPKTWPATDDGNRPLQAVRHTNAGNGPRQQPIALRTSASPIERTDVADINGDGTTDLVVQWQEPLTNTMRRSFWMDGTDSVSAIGDQFFPFDTWHQQTPCIGDLDNDGNIDVARIFGGQLMVMLNNGTGAFSAPQSHNVISHTMPYGLGIGDVTGDGTLDYLWTANRDPGSSGPDSLIWAPNDGTGAPGARHALVMPIFNRGASDATALPSPLIDATDLDGDGTQEIILFNGDSLAVMHTTGGTLTPAQAMVVNARTYALGDMNADGAQDLVLLHSDGTLGLCLGISDALFGSESVLGSTFPSTTGLALGDMSGDGYPDVIVCSPDDGYAAWFGVDLPTRVTEYPAAGDAVLAVPNPATSMVRIVMSGPLSTTDLVSLTDIGGHIVRTVRGSGTREVQFERGNLAAGTYVVRIVRAGRMDGATRLVLH